MKKLSNFNDIVPNRHRFIFHGKGGKSKYFTPTNYYPIVEIEGGDRIVTIDDSGDKHNLSLLYFNDNCELIDIPLRILELFDVLNNALIIGDVEMFRNISKMIADELALHFSIKEDDVEEGQYYECGTQRVKVVRFDDYWQLIRTSQNFSVSTFTVETYDKKNLVKKLNEKNYKRVSI